MLVLTFRQSQTLVFHRPYCLHNRPASLAHPFHPWAYHLDTRMAGNQHQALQEITTLFFLLLVTQTVSHLTSFLLALFSAAVMTSATAGKEENEQTCGNHSAF